MTGPGPEAPNPGPAAPTSGSPRRADRGHHGAWQYGDSFARQRRVRERLARRQNRNRPWFARQGFGCLFGIVFIVVLGSIVTATASLLSTLGPVPAVVAVVAVVAVAAAMFRDVARGARDLDGLLAATRRVQDGDYAVRLGKTRSNLAPIQELGRGFDTMVVRLEADEEQRRSLLADVSHELRTPLAVITANLEAVIDGVYPADPGHLAPILDETRVMGRLIDDLRTITLSEAGTLPLHPEPTDPDLLIGDIVRSFTPAAEAAGVTLITEVDGDLPILDVDPVRVREVLSNLVANALRHTTAGGTVAVGGSATGAEVSLTVRDTGPGIEPELLPHVFDRFVKGDGSHGSGLGLAIARGLVEAHGGSISVRSQVGSGTAFRVALPRIPDS